MDRITADTVTDANGDVHVHVGAPGTRVRVVVDAEIPGELSIDWSRCEAVEADPQRMSGAPCFRGTRVPVAALFENLDGGATVDDFIEWFQGVSKQQVHLVLEFAGVSLAAHRAG